MILTTVTDLRLTVDPDAFLKCPRSRATLHHLLDRLFSGEDIAEAELESWGLRVKVLDEFIAVPRMEEE